MELLVTILLALLLLSAADGPLWPRPTAVKRAAARRPAGPHRRPRPTNRRPANCRPATCRPPAAARRPAPGLAANNGSLWWWE